MFAKKLARELLGKTLLGALDYYRFPEYRNSWGGPFNGQAFRQQIFLELIASISFGSIVETGTYRGTTTTYLHEASRLPVYTVESDQQNYGFSRARFLWNGAITVFPGDSRSMLKRPGVLALSGKPVFFYLDAHWEAELPLKEEVETVFGSFPRAVVMIDDFRVPGDDGYGFDDYGPGKVLELAYLADMSRKFELTAFFPAQRSESETGARRGCVVIAKNPDLVQQLKNMKTLLAHRAAL